MIYTKCKQYIFKPSRSHVQSYFFCRNFSIYNKQNSRILNFCIDPYIHQISKCHLPTCFRETLQQFHIFQDVEIQKLLILTKNLSRRCPYILKAKKFAEPPFLKNFLRKSAGHFWAILGHIWATLRHFGSFLAIFGPFCGIFGRIFRKFIFFCRIVGVRILAFRMYDLILCTLCLLRSAWDK